MNSKSNSVSTPWIGILIFGISIGVLAWALSNGLDKVGVFEKDGWIELSIQLKERIPSWLLRGWLIFLPCVFGFYSFSTMRYFGEGKIGSSHLIVSLLGTLVTITLAIALWPHL